MEVWGLILAGGKGKRFGLKKQFIEVKGKPLFLYSLEVFQSHSKVKGNILIVPEEDIEYVRKIVGREVIVVKGGRERFQSSKNGINSLPDSATHVLIHDAARPNVKKELLDRIILELEKGEEAVIPAIPSRDAVKMCQGEYVLKTLERERIFLAQTPQGFKVSVIREAFERAGGEAFYDDAQLVEMVGKRVKIVKGDEENLKITVPSDLKLFLSLNDEDQREENKDKGDKLIV